MIEFTIKPKICFNNIERTYPNHIIEIMFNMMCDKIKNKTLFFKDDCTAGLLNSRMSITSCKLDENHNILVSGVELPHAKGFEDLLLKLKDRMTFTVSASLDINKDNEVINVYEVYSVGAFADIAYPKNSEI